MINWGEVDTVLLDMDGTLLDLHYDNYFWATHLPQRYADIHKVNLTEARESLSEHIHRIEGTLDWYCLDYWSNALAVDIGQLKKEVKHRIRERPHVQEFLQFLKSHNKHIILATNAHPIGMAIKFNETNIQHYFDHTVTSHQFQHPKEVQEFWHSLSNYLNQHFTFNPERSLFIDDNAKILEAATTYGIAHTLGIHQPDSQTHRHLDDIPAIYHFDEIMPHTPKLESLIWKK